MAYPTLTYFLTSSPFRRVPSEFIPLKVSQLVSGFALVGLVGIIRGWKTVDHMAHLSGLLWGLAFGYWKNQEFKKKRELACKNSG